MTCIQASKAWALRPAPFIPSGHHIWKVGAGRPERAVGRSKSATWPWCRRLTLNTVDNSGGARPASAPFKQPAARYGGESAGLLDPPPYSPSPPLAPACQGSFCWWENRSEGEAERPERRSKQFKMPRRPLISWPDLDTCLNETAHERASKGV